jgi:DNA-binding XRE family transcriptional regulator
MGSKVNKIKLAVDINDIVYINDIVDIKDILGCKVRRLRIDAGFSQQVLAEKSGIFRTYLSRLESGSANPTISVLEALATNLHVEVAELFRE